MLVTHIEGFVLLLSADTVGRPLNRKKEGNILICIKIQFEKWVVMTTQEMSRSHILQLE